MSVSDRCGVPGCTDPAVYEAPVQLITRGTVGTLRVKVCAFHWQVWVMRGVVYRRPSAATMGIEEATAHGPQRTTVS